MALVAYTYYKYLIFSSTLSLRGSLTFPTSIGNRKSIRSIRETIRVQWPSEENPQALKDYRFDGSPANPFGSKDREIGIEKEIPRWRRVAGFGWSAAPSSCHGPTKIPFTACPSTPCVCKPHKLRPEGRDRKLGGEQVREFRRIPIRETCMHMRITPVLFGASRRSSQKTGIPGWEEGRSRARHIGYYISIISAHPMLLNTSSL